MDQSNADQDIIRVLVKLRAHNVLQDQSAPQPLERHNHVAQEHSPLQDLSTATNVFQDFIASQHLHLHTNLVFREPILKVQGRYVWIVQQEKHVLLHLVMVLRIVSRDITPPESRFHVSCVLQDILAQIQQ